MDGEQKSGEWQSGQYPPPQRLNGLKLWLAVIPAVSLVVSFAAGYGGSKYAEGENQQRLIQLEQEVQRLRGEKFISSEEFNRRMQEMREDRREADRRMLERLNGISTDVNKRYSQR